MTGCYKDVQYRRYDNNESSQFASFRRGLMDFQDNIRNVSIPSRVKFMHPLHSSIILQHR